MLSLGATELGATKRAGLRRRCRQGGCAAGLVLLAAVQAGCSLAPSSADPGPATPQAAAAVPAVSGADCPNIDIRTGAGTYSQSGNSTDSALTGVRYQASLSQLARQCSTAGGNLMIKVAVQGRIVLGPAGSPGPIELPLRYAVVQEGLAPKTIATKFKRVPAQVPEGQSNVAFSDVDEGLSFPMPSRAELAGYMVYVGFDEVGDAAEKKPASKKPAAKRKSS